jgi:Binding-protein-dependent transport system inner membrane component
VETVAGIDLDVGDGEFFSPVCLRHRSIAIVADPGLHDRLVRGSARQSIGGRCARPVDPGGLRLDSDRPPSRDPCLIRRAALLVLWPRDRLVPSGPVDRPARDRDGDGLNATINATGIGFTTFTIILGHAAFCIVVVFNNVIARLRRASRSIEEASMDLGPDTLQTFRYVTFPVIRTALIAGGLLAFALSFDEVIVTTFTAGTEATIPLWIFDHMRRANQLPIVNVVAVFLILLSTIPVYLAQRLSSDTSGLAGR